MMHERFWNVRTGTLFVAFAFALVGASVPATAAASDSPAETDTSETSGSDHGLDVGVGARIGGVGFRHMRNERLSWRDCRMDGTGIFATLDFHRNFFAELSVDYYHAVGKTISHGMDRLSVYVLGAMGARFLPDFIVSPYLQVGVGPEWTRMEVGDRSRSMLLAAPFLGVGGEINLGSLKLGSHIRHYSMGVPNHVGAHGVDEGHDGVEVHYESAGQVQFFARWEF